MTEQLTPKAVARVTTLLVLWEASKAGALGDMNNTQIAAMLELEGSQPLVIKKVRRALQLIAYVENEVARLTDKFKEGMK